MIKKKTKKRHSNAAAGGLMKGQLKKKKKNTKTNVEVEERDWRSLSLGDSVRCGDDDEL